MYQVPEPRHSRRTRVMTEPLKPDPADNYARSVRTGEIILFRSEFGLPGRVVDALSDWAVYDLLAVNGEGLPCRRIGEDSDAREARIEGYAMMRNLRPLQSYCPGVGPYRSGKLYDE